MKVEFKADKGVPIDVIEALTKRATALLERHGEKPNKITRGAGHFTPKEGSYEEYYVLSVAGNPDAFPVKRWVAYRKPDGSIGTTATMRPGYTTADLEDA